MIGKNVREEINEAMRKLNMLYSKTVKWEFVADWSQSSYYDAEDKTIHFTAKIEPDTGVAIHEFAHAIFYDRHGMHKAMLEGPHGGTYIHILEEVAHKFYGDAARYPKWNDEYPHITGWAYAKGYTSSPITQALRESDWW